MRVLGVQRAHMYRKMPNWHVPSCVTVSGKAGGVPCDTCAPRAQTHAGRWGTVQQPTALTVSLPAGRGVPGTLSVCFRGKWIDPHIKYAHIHVLYEK